ncbi:MAG: prepilin-type N-terminal cleavage/methylation domain-containing protein [Glaciimonas sp.]|nr:prepilin-type N-terminal cleavage/methylation domain-containing protein [Glaciimonas sp.]
MSRRRSRSQGGFTMVELAIVLVVAGLILVAVLKGTDTLNKAKVERAVADLRGLQGMLLETQKRVNRLPGDCNNDGTIALYPVAVRTFLASAALPNVDATNRNVSLNGSCGTPVTSAAAMTNDLLAGQIVAATGIGAPADTSNLVFNELRRAGVVDGSRTNMELAKHSNGDIFQVGSMQQASGGGLIRANVIVMYGIPVWMAEAIDAAIDGTSQDYAAGTAGVGGPASNGRVRRWDGNTTVTANTSAVFAPVFAQYNDSVAAGDKLLTRDDLVSISYQFDTLKLVN